MQHDHGAQGHRAQAAGSPGPRSTPWPAPWYGTRWGIALIGFAAVSALVLVYEHRLHVPLGNLLVLVPLLACIGLHSLMHGGQGGHGGHGARGASRPDEAATPGTDGAAPDGKAGQS